MSLVDGLYADPAPFAPSEDTHTALRGVLDPPGEGFLGHALVLPEQARKGAVDLKARALVAAILADIDARPSLSPELATFDPRERRARVAAPRFEGANQGRIVHQLLPSFGILLAAELLRRQPAQPDHVLEEMSVRVRAARESCNLHGRGLSSIDSDHGPGHRFCSL